MNAQFYLTEKEAAFRIGVKPVTLRQWRRRKTGPPYTKQGATIQYNIAALRQWQSQKDNHNV